MALKKYLDGDGVAQLWDATKDYVASHASQPAVTSGTEDEAAWLTRETADGFPCGGRATVKAIKGKTVRWAQLAPAYDSEDWTRWNANVIASSAGGELVLTSNTDTSSIKAVKGPVQPEPSHKFLLKADIDASHLSSDVNAAFGIINDAGTSVCTITVDGGTAKASYSLIGATGTATYHIVCRVRNATAKDEYATFSNMQCFDLTLMFGAGNEPSTVAEFEALYPASYYPYSAPTLQSAKPTGIESEDADGGSLGGISIPINTLAPNGLRSAGSAYDELTADSVATRVGAVDLGTLNWEISSASKPHRFVVRFDYAKDNGTSASTLMSNASCAAYETVTAKQAYDGSVDKSVGLAVYNGVQHILISDSAYSDAAVFKASMSGVMLYYELATPTTTPIDPPLNFAYRCDAGGTETVTHTEATSAPTLEVVYEIDGTAAAASIAPLEGRIASTNYSLGSLLMLGGTLVKATTAIATGEQIVIGTNCTRTTVAAELAALS